MFDKLGELKVSQNYHVIGWQNKQGCKCYPLDILLSIYNILIYTENKSFQDGCFCLRWSKYPI